MQQIRKKNIVWICNNRGAGVVEVSIIIVILVLLALVFQTQIEAVLATIMAKIHEAIGGL